MQHEKFDPSRWLDRWRDAGGGWASTHLLLLDGDQIALNRLSQELNDGRRELVRQKLKEMIA